MERVLKKLNVFFVIISILFTFVSFLLTTAPVDFIESNFKVLGYILLAEVVVNLFIFFFTIKRTRLYNYTLSKALLYLIVGLFIIFGSDKNVGLIPLLTGIWIVVNSIFKIQLSTNFINSKSRIWMVTIIITSMILLALGTILLLANFTTIKASLVASLLLLGISQLFEMYTLYSLVKRNIIEE